jgi:FKBP-type peptidyl-prolyl cis-trans isomerase FklB
LAHDLDKDFWIMKRFLFATMAGALSFFGVLAFSVVSVSAQQPRTEQVPANGGAGVTQSGRRDFTPATPTTAATGLTTDKQKASYGIGFRMGGDMRGGQLTSDDIDLQALLRGMTDGLSKAKPALTEQDLQQAMMNFQTELTSRIQEKSKTAGAKNKKEGEAFLAVNKSKDGVKTLPSGLQYKVIKSGNGATPGPTDTVKAHYKGTLLDGTVFDSSYDRGEPVDFPVNHVIKGWTEALQLMKVGDKWQLFVPSELAYGEHGVGGDIGPNAVLVFDVELLDVKKGDNAPDNMLLPPGK